MSLIFDPVTHRYTLNGEPLPSVTELVRPLRNELPEALELTMEAAAERGAALHLYISHLMGEETEKMSPDELPDAWHGYAAAADLWHSEHAIVPLLVEQPLAGDGFAGTPDLVAEYDGRLSVLDYKFVAAVDKAAVGAQLNGYAALCEANGVFPEALYAVQFFPDGEYRVYPVDMDGTAFELCRRLYACKTMKHPRGRIGGCHDPV